MKKILSKLVDFIKRNYIIYGPAMQAYLRISLLFMKTERKEEKLYGSEMKSGTNIKFPEKIAFICDEMTWQDFHEYVQCIYLHPRIWKKQLDHFKPDIIFCESAWTGIEKYYGSWRGRIYKDKRVSFENRAELIKILTYAQMHGIKTVFWNKEDPTYFDHSIYDFIDTALQFDYVFTTAEECIEKYRQRGHEQVHLLPFGVNLKQFYANESEVVKGSAFFAGSWFGDHPKRCEELERLLDYAISQGWKLDIYDRGSNSKETKNRFPEKYNQYLHPAVPFTKMPEICRKYEYAINVNTVVNSSTMISRRVLQLAACGNTILSNDAKGINSLKDCMYVYSTLKNNIVVLKPCMEALQSHSSCTRLQEVLGISIGEDKLYEKNDFNIQTP